MKDKFSAVWISHSSIGDYLKCPRLYYIRNVYKDPKTGHKITRMQPPLALGQIVHDTIQALSELPAEERLAQPLLETYNQLWDKKVNGKLGGFKTSEDEEKYKERGRKMLQRIIDNPGPILNKAIKIKQELPYYWLSEEDNIILCGKIDWLEYLPKTDSVHIIDFKTGKGEEDGDSLQLPIYHLLVENCQNRKATKASYWYLERDNEPKEVPLPNLDEAKTRVLEIAKKIALARKLDHMKCKHEGGCHHCQALEAILRGEGELVGTSEYNQDIYII